MVEEEKEGKKPEEGIEPEVEKLREEEPKEVKIEEEEARPEEEKEEKKPEEKKEAEKTAGIVKMEEKPPEIPEEVPRPPEEKAKPEEAKAPAPPKGKIPPEAGKTPPKPEKKPGKRILQYSLILVLIGVISLSLIYGKKFYEIKKSKKLYDQAKIAIDRYYRGETDDFREVSYKCKKVMENYPNSKYVPELQFYLVTILDVQARKEKDRLGPGALLEVIKIYEPVVEEYRKVVVNYPASEYAPQARFHRAELIGELATLVVESDLSEESYPGYKELFSIERAIQEYRKVITDYPENDYAGPAQFCIGRLFESQGRPEQALDEYKKFIAHYPESVKREEVTEKIKILETNIAKIKAEAEAEARKKARAQSERERAEAEAKRVAAERKRAEDERKRIENQRLINRYNSAKQRWDYLYRNASSIAAKEDEQFRVSWDIYCESMESIGAVDAVYGYLYSGGTEGYDPDRKVTALISRVDKDFNIKPQIGITLGDIIRIEGLFIDVDHKGFSLMVTCSYDEWVKLR